MRRLLFIPAIALSGLLIACSDNTDASTPAPTATNVAALDESPAPEDQPQGLQFVLDSVGGNIDLGELRKHLAPELQGMTDEELSEMSQCFPSDVSAEVLDQEVTENGSTATLLVTWQVTKDGASTIETEVEREWTFERVTATEDGGYYITSLPSECPFVASDPGGTQEPAIESPTPD